MIYNIEEVMRDVRVCIDQNMTSEQLVLTEDADTLALDDIVRSKILDAVTRVHKTAPAYMLEEGHTFGDAVYWGDKESGWVLLPDDFMRLIVFEMSDWSRSVYVAISADDPKYALQRQRIKALRGTCQKPVCAIVARPEGKALEFYSCKSEDAYVRKALYLPYPRVDAYGGIDISERCYMSIIYAAAALVLVTVGEGEKAATLNEISKSRLE